MATKKAAKNTVKSKTGTKKQASGSKVSPSAKAAKKRPATKAVGKRKVQTKAAQTASKKAAPKQKTSSKKPVKKPEKAAKPIAKPASRKKAVNKVVRTRQTASARKASKSSASTRAKQVSSKANNPTAAKKLTKRDLDKLRDELLSLRAELTGQIDSLKMASLKREDDVVSPEDGTDAFDRQFNLSIVRSEGDSLFEVEEALRRIDDGTYGVCEACDEVIPKARLEALPFVKNCVRCQSEMEKGKARFRPMAEDHARF
jgi:DnaK suppressor protein